MQIRYAYWLVPVLGLLGVVLVGSLLGASASFSFRHPQAPEIRFIVSRAGAVRLEEYVKADAHSPLPSGQESPSAVLVPEGASEPPRIALEETDFDFGIMNPLTMGEHGFIVQNVGKGPLQLRSGGTTCKCTLADLPAAPIPAGASAEIRIQWNTGRDPLYAHQATILTNDPARPRIELRIHGFVQVLCDARPKAIQFTPQDPDSTATATVELYSRAWNSFEVASGTSSVPGVQWTAKPLDPQRCKELNATCGFAIEVTAPADLPKGAFQGVLLLKLVPETETADAQTFELPFAGQMNGRMTVYGAGREDSLGAIQLGVTPRGTPLERRLLVRVRDSELPRAEQFRIETRPAHLQARIIVRASESSALGLYFLELHVPADAPAGAHVGIRQGKVRIVPDHPRLEPLEIPVEFGVLASP